MQRVTVVWNCLLTVAPAYALWLISVIFEIWFALSWILDQFPKWVFFTRVYDYEGRCSCWNAAATAYNMRIVLGDNARE